MLNRNLVVVGMFGNFINCHSLAFIKFLRSLGFNDFWINAFLWLPVKLALLELRIKFGSLENYLHQCDEQRRIEYGNSKIPF